VVLGGDFRQILPVIEGGTRSQIVNAAIINSPLWSHVTILQLTQNMRLSAPNITEEERNKIVEFSTWLLDIGDSNIKAIAKEKEEEPCWITIPHEYLLLPEHDKISCIVNTTLSDLHTNYADAQYIKDRAILTPTNDIADTINSHIVSVIPGEAKQYLSSNRIVKASNTYDSYDLLYPIEFLHTLNANNFPHHELILKKGVLVMLLRNINQSEGLCNGTRLIITALGDIVIEVQLITRTYQGKKVLIPWISLTLKTTEWPFILERRQYPIKIAMQ
jgi:ATP-dependent DNA helicase PIF1